MDERGDRPEAVSDRRPPPGGGWRTAIVRALLAAAVLLLLAEAVIFLAYAAADNPDKPSAGTVARYGGVLFYAFHHVGVRFEASGPGPAGPATPFGRFAGGSIAFAALAGTALALWLLYVGGRAVAREAGGSTLGRGVHGLKVAVPYGALTVAGSFLLRFELSGGGLTIHPSYVAALLWPLGLAAAAGFAGGVHSGHRDGWARLVPDRETLGRRLNGALAGGWWMLVFGLIFAFAGLLVLAVVKPDATAAYFSSFHRGKMDGILAIVATLLVLPNLAAWALFPAMGSCIGLSGTLSICFLSYRHFPSGPAALTTGTDTASLDLPGAPVGFYLFLLVPLAAVLIGGAAAARKGRATTSSEAAALGAFGGVVFAALSLLTILLASLTVRISGSIGGLVAGRSFRIGPELTSGVLLALGWGVAGGALGGLWEGRSLHPRSERPPEPEGLPADAPRP